MLQTKQGCAYKFIMSLFGDKKFSNKGDIKQNHKQKKSYWAFVQKKGGGGHHLVTNFATNASGVIWWLYLFQVTELISGSVVPLAKFLYT